MSLGHPWDILGSWDTPRTTLAFYGNPGPPCKIKMQDVTNIWGSDKIRMKEMKMEMELSRCAVVPSKLQSPSL